MKPNILSLYCQYCETLQSGLPEVYRLLSAIDVGCMVAPQQHTLVVLKYVEVDAVHGMLAESFAGWRMDVRAD